MQLNAFSGHRVMPKSVYTHKGSDYTLQRIEREKKNSPLKSGLRQRKNSHGRMCLNGWAVQLKLKRGIALLENALITVNHSGKRCRIEWVFCKWLYQTKSVTLTLCDGNLRMLIWVFSRRIYSDNHRVRLYWTVRLFTAMVFTLISLL